MNNKFRLTSIGLFSALSINSAMAMPIDWTGVFGADTHLLSNTCRTNDDVTKFDNLGNRAPGTAGTQGLQNGDCDANFQTYTFRLNPSIIINDGVTLKGEISTAISAETLLVLIQLIIKTAQEIILIFSQLQPSAQLLI